ncbi:hypothetical protein LQ50_07995 [Halalkalibacter okhensis]|uniref:Uncharacterized protein n=2 Tax=Halalkalibacter okhensis TaxID=333138 RepID=A0A0B0IKY0_9BACI|nr:hypothetical protein LQ50_07995 [Halalkalibacter okhensis]
MLDQFAKRVEEVLGQSINKVQELVSGEFATANKLLELMRLLSIETGLTQQEIGNIRAYRFLQLAEYHDLWSRIDKGCEEGE